jgi:hypothetical protein
VNDQFFQVVTLTQSQVVFRIICAAVRETFQAPKVWQLGCQHIQVQVCHRVVKFEACELEDVV